MGRLTEPLRLRLTEEQYRRLELAAKRDGRPISNMARRLIDLGTRAQQNQARQAQETAA